MTGLSWEYEFNLSEVSNMRKIKQLEYCLLLCILVLATVCSGEAMRYDYPFEDPYEATILGTPEKAKAPLPKKIRIKERAMTVFPDREVPEIFWYNKKLLYSVARQRQKAPLIFMIAGTGAGHDSAKMQMMQKAFFQAGFHVVSISSPTHPSFIVGASSLSLPGDIRSDSRDLYRVMELAWQKEQKSIEVSDFFLTGYSLGGSQSAFVAKLDEEQKLFNFKKVLMINPALNLYDSAVRIDKMFVNNIPGGIDQFNAWYEKLMANVTESYKHGDFVDLSYGFFYNAYDEIVPSQSEAKAVIGFSFRVSLATMLFVSDVMTNSGLIVPKNLQLKRTASLTDYSKVSARAGGFSLYADDLLFPAFKDKRPSLSMKQFVHDNSLRSIESYLRNAKKIALVTNENDFILGAGDVDYLKQVFQSRARIYPKGGHCGNMAYKDNVAYMIDYFKNP